jgi:hypothetical protein
MTAYFTTLLLICVICPILIAIYSIKPLTTQVIYLCIDQSFCVMHDKQQEAVSLYGRSRCYNHAIRLAKVYGLDAEVMSYAMQSTQAIMIDAAHYFEVSNQCDINSNKHVSFRNKMKYISHVCSY